MNAQMASISWGEAALGAALVELARALELGENPGAMPGAPPLGLDPERRERWLEACAAQLGIELRATSAAYVDLARVLRAVGPCLLRLELGTAPRYLAVLASRRRHLLVLTPALRRTVVPHRRVQAALTSGLERGASGPVRGWLDTLGVSPRRRRRAERGLLELMLEERRVEGLYLVRPDPGSSFARQLALRGLLGRAWLTLALGLGSALFLLLGWALLGRGALHGQLEAGWVGAWVLSVVSASCLAVAVTSFGGDLVQEASVLLKRRLLSGALRVDPDELRRAGSGRLLATVLESRALEQAGLAGGVGLVLSAVQLASAAGVVALGAGGASQLLLLLGWCLWMARLAQRHQRLRSAWTEERLRLARSFVENVVGNRTRIVQQAERRWHLDEDQRLEAHLASSASMDGAHTRLSVLAARGWMVVGCAGLFPVLLAGAERTELAIAVGGILQAYGALAALAAGAVTLGSAQVAWAQLAPLFQAARRRERPARMPALVAGERAPRTLEPGGAPEPGRTRELAPLLDVRGVSYRYPGRDEAVLRGCDLVVLPDEHILLEGPSGGGKSTLAALLAGMREPSAGHILCSGLDRATLGERGWRRRVASAPQFHENHLVSGSLAFNLLMGRAWPASPSDLCEAEAVCRALGLGALIARMPSRLNQIIGETGWQLSHGERSRVFLARALLQGADVLVLDESFGALDARTLGDCLEAVLARARALIVIAHP